MPKNSSFISTLSRTASTVDKALSDGGVEDRGSKLDDRILKPAPLASCQHHHGRLSQLRDTRHDNRPRVGGFGEGSRWESSRES
jgi:hypothetical protein